MDARALITVAIPTCNGARHLAEALRSVRVQEDVEYELVISDDRSDDETLAIARAETADRARISVNPERLGLAGNWNRCVALSRTPWVAVFHQDDVLRPGHLAAHRAAILGGDRWLGMVASAAEVIDAAGRVVPRSVIERSDLGPSDRIYPPGAFVAELAAGNPVRCSGVTLRAEAHSALGGFDARYRYVVDWDLWLRLSRAWSVAWLARSTVAVRWHAASETHRFKTGTEDLDEAVQLMAELFEQDETRFSSARQLRRAANRRLARAFLNRSYEALRAGDSALARRCLRRSVALWPGILGTIALDPRLVLRLLLPSGR